MVVYCFSTQGSERIERANVRPPARPARLPARVVTLGYCSFAHVGEHSLVCLLASSFAGARSLVCYLARSSIACPRARVRSFPCPCVRLLASSFAGARSLVHYLVRSLARPSAGARSLVPSPVPARARSFVCFSGTIFQESMQ